MCFDTVLGQAIFDNTGCTGPSVQLAPEFAQFVESLAQQEQREGCRIDTTQPVLNLPDLAIRQRLVELPVAGDSPGFNCIGWRGGVLPLYSSRSANSAQVGRIEEGDFVGMWHGPGPTWVYVLTYTRAGGPLKSGGWMQPGVDANVVCGEQAG